jgi:hypothetical protein
LAIESIAAQQAEVGELRRRGLYDSAMLDAFKGNDGAGKNTLPKSAHFAIYYPNLLIPEDDFDQMHFRGERFLFFFQRIVLAASICFSIVAFANFTAFILIALHRLYCRLSTESHNSLDAADSSVEGIAACPWNLLCDREWFHTTGNGENGRRRILGEEDK